MLKLLFSFMGAKIIIYNETSKHFLKNVTKILLFVTN